MDKKRPYKVVEHQEYPIGRFTIIKDTLEIGGMKYPYSYERAGDCVCVLPIIENDIVLIRQYRHSFNEWLYEIPAGGLDEEQPEAAAKRELLEETGYVAEQLLSLGKYPVSQGTSTAVAHLFVAICKEKREQKLDATEIIQTERVSREKFMQMIENREFTHMVGIVAWHLHQLYFEENKV